MTRDQVDERIAFWQTQIEDRARWLQKNDALLATFIAVIGDLQAVRADLTPPEEKVDGD